MDDIYWNSISFGSDEESIPEASSKPYVDPWDLENYAYIRSHLDSAELNSDPSSSGDFAEQNSTSFYYVPGVQPIRRQEKMGKYDSLMTEQGYAAIDEVRTYDRRPKIEERRIRSHSRDIDFDSDSNESPYEESFNDASLYVYGTREQMYKKVPISIPTTPRDRSLSFSYGDYAYSPRSDIYCKLDDLPRRDSTLPLYEEDRRIRRTPNFGLSNYGHLKIDYSYSWNNLNKYICK